MKIAIDISPLESGHKVRGVGFYLLHLKKALEKMVSSYEVIYFTGTPPRDVDLIHYPYFDPFFITLPLYKQVPTVITIHDLTPIVFPKYFPSGIKGSLNWQLNKRLVRGIDHVITDSDSSTRDVIRYIGLPDSKVSTVYLAAGEEFRQLSKTKDLKTKYNLPDKFALYIGDVTWNKNLPRIIQAAEEAGIPLILVGKSITEKNFDRKNPWNKDRIQVQELLSQAKYAKALGFIDTDDLVGLYNRAAVLMMPSLYEGFGLPVLEAMQSGCPVVTSREGSLPEVGGEAALYVNAYDVDSIRKGITKVFESTELQKELKKKGLEQAAKFSWEKTATETIAVYRQVFQKKF